MTLDGVVDFTFAYDAWGRTVSKAVMNWSAVYEYRFGDKLKLVTTDIPGEASVSFNYDGMGRRRVKVNLAEDAWTWYRYDAGWNALAEYGPGEDPETTWDIGTREAGHVYMGMTALAEIDGANPATGTTRHFAHDHLGSLRTAWGADRTLRARAEYLPYGEFLAGITDERIPAGLFTGKSLDFETMLYHFPYRYYNPFAARWLTRDPLGMVDGPNVYAYVRGACINQYDPLGLKCDSEDCENLLLAIQLTCGTALGALGVTSFVDIAICSACVVTCMVTGGVTCVACITVCGVGIGAIGFILAWPLSACRKLLNEHNEQCS